MDEFKKDNAISYLEIVENLDIEIGDTLLIASDAGRLLRKTKKSGNDFNPNLFIDTFIKKIGSEGTLLFPTYNFDFCTGSSFDIKNTPSKMGVLTNAALKREDFARTAHPIYSFAVAGKYSKHLQSMSNKSSYGNDSPFAFLHKNNAKMLIIDLDYQHSFTFVHYVEEQNKVDYRYPKDFSGEYIDIDGNASIKTFSMYVRNLEKGVQTHVNPIGEILEQQGISKIKTINDIEFKLIDLSSSYYVIENDIKNNSAKNLYKIDI